MDTTRFSTSAISASTADRSTAAHIGTYALPEGLFASFVFRRTDALGIAGSSGPYGHLDARFSAGSCEDEEDRERIAVEAVLEP
jgi:hypothetical protein